MFSNNAFIINGNQGLNSLKDFNEFNHVCAYMKSVALNPLKHLTDWSSEVLISVDVPHVLLLFLSRPQQ